MKIGISGRIVLSLSLLAAALPAAEHYQVVNGPKDFYYGHISYIDPAAEGEEATVTREGKPGIFQAVLNLPLGPGDTIRTSAGRRCEIQFDSGTIVRLDFDTELKIETVLARSLSNRVSLSNLALKRGRIYAMYKEYSGSEMFQVLAPRAAVKMKHNAVAIIAAGADGSTETQVKAGKAEVLFGPSEKSLKSQTVGKGKRLIVGKNDEAQLIPDFEGAAFELWNRDINARFLDLHEGRTPIPKPIEKYPKAVQYFAQTYGNLYGEWIWDGLFGYVWRPFTNDISIPGYSGINYSVNGWQPGQGWQPYYYGQWTAVNDQMFWVPQEPWGWVPFHLGIWHWNKKLGWVWIPGSAFSPAWADWNFFFGFGYGRPIWLNSWTPISVYQWMAYGRWFSDPAFQVYWDVRNIYGPGRRLHLPLPEIPRGPSSFAMLCPVPSSIIENVARAIKNGDPRILEELGDQNPHTVFVAGADVNARAIHEKALTWEQAEKAGLLTVLKSEVIKRSANPEASVLRAFSGVQEPARSMPASSGRNIRGSEVYPAGDRSTVNVKALLAERAVTRFRDWNPDIAVARGLGVRIEYSSARNEIRCPELNISSFDRLQGNRNAMIFSPRATGFATSGNPGAGTSNFSGSSGSAASGGAHSPRDSGRNSGGPGGHSSNSGGGEAIKK